MQDDSTFDGHSDTDASLAGGGHDGMGQISPALTETSMSSIATASAARAISDGIIATDASILPQITFTPPAGNSLHKRRANSPNKFNVGRFEPLRINTNLPIPSGAPPSKRTKTENRIEIEYDSAGTPRVKQTPTTPIAFSPFATSALSELPAHALAPLTGETSSSGLPSAVFQSGQGVSALRRLYEAQRTAPAESPKATKQKTFGLIDAFIADSSLCILLVSYLDVPSLISLYAISKKFHWYFNKNATGFILSSMRTWSPNADEIFPWRCYESLCIKDPIKRQKAKATAFGADIERLNLFSRDVPSLRWLQMVVWRDSVVKDIMITMMTKALRLPRGTRMALKRMWFMLDLPRNAHRLALMRSKEYIPDRVLHLLTHFFLKVDMFFTDPAYELFSFNALTQQGLPPTWTWGAALGCSLREKLLAEKSLTPLWRVIRGWSPDPAAGFRPIRSMDILKLWVRHRFRFRQNAPQDLNRNDRIMRSPMQGFMMTGYERIWTPESYDDAATPATATAPQMNRPMPLLRPDQLVMGEAINRQLVLHREWVLMMCWGFVNPFGRDVRVRTEEDILKLVKEPWTPKEKRQIGAALRREIENKKKDTGGEDRMNIEKGKATVADGE